MELRQLKYFTTTAEFLNFSEAARALNITQSTLSQQIATLEGELGVKLFERTRHSMTLTDIGKAFLPSALRTIHDAESCIDRIHDVLGLEEGEINIGTTYTFSPLLRETVLDFMRKHPKIKLNIYCKSMEELLDLLIHRKIDVALSYKPMNLCRSIESHILFDSSLCVAVGREHPLAAQRSVTFRDVERFPVCLPAKGMQARNTLDRILETANHTSLDVRLEINDINILLDLVAKSNLLTFLSQATLIDHPEIAGVPISGVEASMQGSFHIIKDSYIKTATRNFLKSLCENKSFSMARLSFLN